MGARPVLVTGTGSVGCVPVELAQRSRAGECAVELQQAADLFNPQLTQMIRELNSQLGAQVLVAANSMQMHMDFVSNPQVYGIPLSYNFKKLEHHCLLSFLFFRTLGEFA